MADECDLIDQLMRKCGGNLDEALRATIQPSCAFEGVREICAVFAKCLNLDEAELLRQCKRIRRHG